MDKEPQKAESGGSSKSLDQDEKFSLLAPYVKLSADPQEVYLNMRVRGGVATEEEKQKLIQLQNQRTQKEKMLPDHAWLMEPCFPDVINEYQYTQQPFIHPPHHTHPEERIWAGRTPRVPDAPRIKHDKMKQFYMVDMRRKRW